MPVYSHPRPVSARGRSHIDVLAELITNSNREEAARALNQTSGYMGDYDHVRGTPPHQAGAPTPSQLGEMQMNDAKASAYADATGGFNPVNADGNPYRLPGSGFDLLMRLLSRR